MASCKKCGGKVRRHSAGTFSCKRCGFQPGPRGLDRSGTIEAPLSTVAEYTAEIGDYVVGNLQPERAEVRISR